MKPWNCDCRKECSTPFGITESKTVTMTQMTKSERLCSTPFGITASGTLRTGGLGGGRRHVLNAFRHHSERDCPWGSRAGRPGRVLNAFRHHGERDCCAWRRSRRFRACSTPFGITASGTLEDGTTQAHSPLCSTPFGITASGTNLQRHVREDLPRAQRLSASRRAGQTTADAFGEVADVCSTPFGITASGTTLVPFFDWRGVRCSTPFGITASGTSPRRGSRATGRVLNAFRHHGERDVPSAPEICRDSTACAQRLSASRRAGRRCNVWCACGRSAQRLSASRRAGLVKKRRCVGASRAQRLSASRRAGHSPSCSTQP